MEIGKKKVENDFLLRLVMLKEQLGDSACFSTIFGIQNEEDNLLYFYYHALDIAKGIVDGTIMINNMSTGLDEGLKHHPHVNMTSELLNEHMTHILDEIESFKSFKNGLDNITKRE